MRASDYFEVVQSAGNVFRFRLFGFLSAEAVEQVGSEIERTYQRTVDSFRGSPFIVVSDLRKLEPLPEVAKQLVSRLMQYGGTRGLYYSININPTALIGMGIKSAGRKTTTSEIRSIVATEEEALKLLAQKLAVLRMEQLKK